MNRLRMLMKWLSEITKHPIPSGLILLFLTGVYGTETQKLEEWFTLIIKAINTTLDFMIFILNYEVAIWKVIVFFIVVVGTLILFYKWKDKQKNSDEVNVEEEAKEINTNTIENFILEVYKKHYNITCSVQEIGIELNADDTDMLVIEQHIDSLVKKSLLLRNPNYLHGTTYELTWQGRDYILEHLIEKNID